MNVQTFDALQAASRALATIAAEGHSIEVTGDFSAIPKIAKDMGKPHLTPLLSPMNHDFSSQTSFWLVLRNQDGVPEGCIGARLEHVEKGEITEYLSRVLSRHYPDAGPLELSLSGTARQVLAGRLAYIGDLYINLPSDRGISVGSSKRLSAMLTLMHTVVALEWKVDAAYSFITERDALRGAGSQYGYTIQLPMQKNWSGRPPKNRYDNEWLIILPSDDREAVFRR